MSSGSNFLVAMNCQLIGPSRSPSSTRPWLTKRSTDSPGLGQHAAVGAEARGLHREHEAVGRLGAPLGPARRLEARIVGAVDLDRGELAAGIFQLALVGQVLGIEHAAPGLEGPAADADIDLACHTALPIRPWMCILPAQQYKSEEQGGIGSSDTALALLAACAAPWRRQPGARPPSASSRRRASRSPSRANISAASRRPIASTWWRASRPISKRCCSPKAPRSRKASCCTGWSRRRFAPTSRPRKRAVAQFKAQLQNAEIVLGRAQALLQDPGRPAGDVDVAAANQQALPGRRSWAPRRSSSRRASTSTTPRSARRSTARSAAPPSPPATMSTPTRHAGVDRQPGSDVRRLPGADPHRDRAAAAAAAARRARW